MTDDELLRRAGFRIFSRPATAEPRWMRKGRVYTQVSALRVATDEQKEKKEKVSVAQKKR